MKVTDGSLCQLCGDSLYVYWFPVPVPVPHSTCAPTHLPLELCSGCFQLHTRTAGISGLSHHVKKGTLSNCTCLSSTSRNHHSIALTLGPCCGLDDGVSSTCIHWSLNLQSDGIRRWGFGSCLWLQEDHEWNGCLFKRKRYDYDRDFSLYYVKT